MHQRVENGQDITESKKITAYLQGRATRGLTAMKSSALYFSAGAGVLLAAYWLLRKDVIAEEQVIIRTIKQKERVQ